MPLIELTSEDPREWVNVGGAPAAAILRAHEGLAAYESDLGALKVMEMLIVFWHDPTEAPLLLPRSYYDVSRTFGDEGLVPLHHDPDAMWSWRPLLYRSSLQGLERLGSQQELEYRRGLWEVGQQRVDAQEAIDRLRDWCLERRYEHERYLKLARLLLAMLEAERPELPMIVARENAYRILRENLTVQQRLELAAHDWFHVRGRINQLYRIQLGNGFDIVDADTHEPKVSLCLHPEEWLPYADVALATKLAIDAGEKGEEELLSAARPRVIHAPGRDPVPAVVGRLERRWDFYP